VSAGRPRVCWILAVAGIVLAACAPSNVYLSKSFSSSGKVALLPMINETNDLDGPPFVRGLLFNALARRGFELLPLGEVDAKLKEQGFTDGGQLQAATPEQIGAWTGADLLFYGRLEEFNYISLGFYSQRKVKVAGKLVDARTGERLWEAERGFTTQKVVANKRAAEGEFAAQLAVKAAEKLMHAPLQAESRLAVNELMRTLPNRP